MTDALAVLQALIRCPSVTPHEGGALDYAEKLLSAHGFICHRLPFSAEGTPDVDNLFARFGTEGPHLCFAGHTDVVPVGDVAAWTEDPFGGTVKDGYIYGRGTCDMKGAIACFIAAAIDYTKDRAFKGSISFLLTGDEEGPAINGTQKVLQWMAKNGHIPDFCIVGEPTSKDVLGDMIKIGRRGSLSGYVTVKGTQGHVAYPQLADNPLPRLLTLLKAIDDLVLDAGTAHFQPSNLEIVNIHTGNKAENVIPAEGHATFNVRFNDVYTGATLEQKLRNAMDETGIAYELKTRVSGESFYTPPGIYSDMVAGAVQKVTGIAPDLSTTGGTSDARFIRQYCPVVECGVPNTTAHKVDERILLSDVTGLTAVYAGIIERFFAA
jgi:succinyl-diaminopimelate desuccinylase